MNPLEDDPLPPEARERVDRFEARLRAWLDESPENRTERGVELGIRSASSVQGGMVPTETAGFFRSRDGGSLSERPAGPGIRVPLKSPWPAASRVRGVAGLLLSSPPSSMPVSCPPPVLVPRKKC